jgi:hypothetical protein
MKRRTLARNLFFTLAAAMLIAALAAPVLASPATATRTLPSSVASGAEFDVAIEASGCGAFGQVVETLPDGFTYLSCSSGDIGVEQIGNTIKFSFLDDPASFTYRVKAPTLEVPTTYTFQGVVLDQDRVSCPMADDPIVVGAELAEIVWNCHLGNTILIAPNPDAGRPLLDVAADCADINVSAGAELWGIYHLVETGPDAGTWLWYAPGYATSTLIQLEPGKYYLVVASTPCILWW